MEHIAKNMTLTEFKYYFIEQLVKTAAELVSLVQGGESSLNHSLSFIATPTENSTMRFGKLLTLGAVMGLAMIPAAHADQSVVTGAAASSGGAGAAADLNFRIRIPTFIVFRVGSVASTDEILFAPTALEVADATADIAGTGGDAAASAVNVRLVSNGGAITITETNNGGGTGLNKGADSISYAQIDTTETGGGGISPPTLSDAGGNTSTPAVTAGNVTARSTVWTYDYDNTATPPEPGDYTGTVTYTAAIP